MILEPELRPLPDAEAQALAALCQRRNQLLEREEMEKNRLQRAPRANQKSIKAMLRFLRRQIEQVERQIEHSIRNSALWQAKRELLESMPAIGKKKQQYTARPFARARAVHAPEDLCPGRRGSL